MKDNEELVLDNTENVDEQATEELVDGGSETIESESEKEVSNEGTTEEEEKKYTDADVDEIVGKKLYRQKQKLQDQYEKKYGRVEELLKQGMDKETFDEAIDSLEDFYKEKGVQVNTPEFTSRETELLAKAEADEIISDGYDEVTDEVQKLANKINRGKATNKDKLVYDNLTKALDRKKSIDELESIGVKEDDLNDKNFKEFSKKLSDKMSLKDKYEFYQKYKPKPKVEKMGSLKNGSNETQIKSFYTFEEANKFTKEELDKNPKLVEAIENSMTKW